MAEKFGEQVKIYYTNNKQTTSVTGIDASSYILFNGGSNHIYTHGKDFAADPSHTHKFLELSDVKDTFSIQNTSDTWVPVIVNGKIYHRIIPAAYNQDPSTLSVNSANTANIANSLSATCAANDYIGIKGGGSNDNGYLEIYTGDNGNEPIYLKQYSYDSSVAIHSATLLDSNGNTSFPGTISSNGHTVLTNSIDPIISVACTSSGILTFTSNNNNKYEFNFNHTHDLSQLTGKIKVECLPDAALKDTTYSYSVTQSATNNNANPYLTLTPSNSGTVSNIQLAGGSNVTITRDSASKIIISSSWRPLGTGSNDAAAGNHTHDSLVVDYADSTSFNAPYHNFQVLYAGGGNSIEGKPSDVDAFGLLRFRVASGWSGQMLLANDGDLYIRSAVDSSFNKSLPWKKIIDSGNIGSQSVNYANSAGNADTVDGVHMDWSSNYTEGNYLAIWDNDGKHIRPIPKGSASVGYATTAGTATNADTADTAIKLKDYNGSNNIYCGYAGDGLNSDNIGWMVGIKANPTGNNIYYKNVSKGELQKWLGLGARAYDNTNYLPLSGGTMNGDAVIYFADSNNWGNGNKGVTFPLVRGGFYWSGQSDWVSLKAIETASDNLDLVLQFGGDNSNGLSIRNKDNTQVARINASGIISAASFVKNGGLSSQFLKADGSIDGTAYLPLSGGTMTGIETISATSAISFANRTTYDTRASYYTSGNYIHGGEDTASQDGANIQIGTWYGFGIYPTISGQTRTQGKNSFWHNARTGNTYTWGEFYSYDGSTNRKVLHEGNSSVSKSGETLTVKINSTSQSLTNTWRGIQNNLTSTSTTDSLSAYQGHLLANGSARDNTKLPLAGGTMVGTVSASSDAYGGGGFHNGYANIILRGNTTTGTSGIVFSSSKGDTSINRPSDWAFIQYHPYGVSAATAVGTNPTIGTSGEAGRFVIGIHNDPGDQLWLQTSAANDLKHVVGANVYTIYDSGNLPAYPTKASWNYDDRYSFSHQSSFAFNIEHNSNYVTFDGEQLAGAPNNNWYNGFVSTHNNYLSSYLINSHRTSDWYVGYSENKTAPTWYKLIHSGNIGSQSVNYANSAGNADTVDGVHMDWSSNYTEGNYLAIWDNAGNCIRPIPKGSASVGYATNSGTASKVYGQVGDTGSHELVRCDMNNDQFRIIAGSNDNNNGWVEIATADDGTEPIYVRQYTGVFSNVARTATLLDGGGNTSFPGSLSAQGGNFYTDSNGAYWTSDIRKKHDFSNITKDIADKFFEKNYFKHFKWNDTNHDSWGVAAQEFEEWAPEAINTNEDGFKSANYDVAEAKAIAAMTYKIKEQQITINELKEKLKNFEKMLNKLI